MMRLKKTLIGILTFCLTLFAFACDNDAINSDVVNAIAKVEESTISKIDKPVETVFPIDSFCFVGDINISKRIQDRYDEYGILGIIENSYLDIFKNVDLTVANLEGPITDIKAIDEKRKFAFSTPIKYAKCLKEMNIGVFNLANNHILDAGLDGLEETTKTLDELNIKHIGTGKNLDEATEPFIKEINGRKYAIFSASSVLPDDSWKATDEREGVSNGYDITSICNKIKNIKKKVDKVIVYMHWGIELDEISTTSQRRAAKSLVSAGADLIIGSHPHVTEEIEYIKDVPIVYSLGDFIYGGTAKPTYMVVALFNYMENPDGEVELRVFNGISNYEKVTLGVDGIENSKRYIDLSNKSRGCFILENGVVMSKAQFDRAMAKLASTSTASIVSDGEK